LQLIPTEKIVKVIRRLAKRSLLVQFKLEVKRKGLFKEAQKSLKENKSDFVVANALEDLRLGHKVFLIDGHEKAVTLGSKRELFSALQKIIQGLEYQMRPIFFQASPPKAAGRRKNVRLNLTPTPILKKRVGGKEFGLLKNRRLF
jgi:hypothetical protein